MERTGVDLGRAARKSGGASIAQARNIYLRCMSDRQCRSWLERTEGLAGPPEFCPNAALLRELRRQSALTVHHLARPSRQSVDQMTIEAFDL